MSSYINSSLHMVMINLNPTLWRTHQSNPRLACCLYKTVFPMITPTMKKRTPSASSPVLRPSSFPATADAGAGLLLCAVFLIRRPSSSCGAKTHFKDSPRHQKRKAAVQLSRGLVGAGEGVGRSYAQTPSHDMVPTSSFCKWRNSLQRRDWLEVLLPPCIHHSLLVPLSKAGH